MVEVHRNILSLTAVLFLCGCASSPWSSDRPAGVPSTITQPAPAAAPAQPVPSPPTPPAATTSATPNTQQLQEVMAELQQTGTLDPAAQNKLLSDLQATDPSLWPLVMQQFRATIAYRRNNEKQELASAPPSYPHTSNPPPTMAQSAPTNPAFGNQSPQTTANQPLTTYKPPQHTADQFNRLPIANESVLPPTKAPHGPYPDTKQPASPHDATNKSPTVNPAHRIVPPSLGLQPTDNWKDLLSATITSLEKSTNKPPQTADEVTEHARLRLLYLVANRRNDLMQPIPAATPSIQDFWSKELYGLSTWLDTERTPEEHARAAQAKHQLSEAVDSLSELAPLRVYNMAFCTEVQSFGSIKRFETEEFSPGQEVLIYAEIDNFKSEQTPKGYHTSLRSSYQIFDSRGQRVDEHDFSTTEETSEHPRRDFFIGYHIHLPKRIYPGKHTLQLTIEDVKSRKIGQTSIDFMVKSPKK